MALSSTHPRRPAIMRGMIGEWPAWVGDRGLLLAVLSSVVFGAVVGLGS